MTQTQYAQVAELINDIYEGALFTLREDNLLVRTVHKPSQAFGMQPRKVTKYGGDSNIREVAEGEDVAATQLTRTLLQTLTPARHADAFILTDQRVATDPEDVRLDAVLEAGQGTAEFVDQTISGHSSSLTGGTACAAGSAMTCNYIAVARARLQAAKVRGPYWCALHPYQWHDLFSAAVISDSEIKRAPQFQDNMVNNYFQTSIFGDVTFVITANISVDASDDATGAMYSPLALAYDERKAFNVRPERDESREAWELNYSLWFASGVWDASRGIQIISDASAPS